MNEEKLKSILIQLREEDVDWEDVNVDELVDLMLLCTQTEDLELKEELIEPSIATIIREGYISEPSMEKLAKRLLTDDYLYFEIGDVENRSKMTRTFSAYVAYLLLKRDAEDAFLSGIVFDQLSNSIVLYLDLEQDYRNYTVDMGFVNSFIYTIDGMHEVVRNTRTDPSYFPKLFQPLLNKIFTHQTHYMYDEEKHVTDTIFAMMKRGFPEKRLVDFFARIPDFLSKQKEKLTPQQYWSLYKNCKALLQEMYIKIDDGEENALLLLEVKNCLKKL